ncbi:MAG: GGDEF domain-containing protein [Calditrichaeota bacterium]|nr:GGDEF domain-containing protein [Calditrichota bacterium]
MTPSAAAKPESPEVPGVVQQTPEAGQATEMSSPRVISLLSEAIRALDHRSPDALGALILPAVLARQLGSEEGSERLKGGWFYRLGNGTGLQALAHLPRRHPLRDVAILLYSSPVMATGIVLHRGDGERWRGLICLDPFEATREAISLSQAMLPVSTDAADHLEALARSAAEVRPSSDSDFPTRLLRALLGSSPLPGGAASRESDIRWLRAMTRIQDAVGWELEEGRLNNSIARSLKETIGYDYFELMALQSAGRRFDVISEHHRNDTAFGGDLLTMMLKAERQMDILRGRTPVLIDRASAGRYLANPKLMNYMGLEAGLLLPLLYQRRVNGLLKIFSRHPGQYLPSDSSRFEAIGKIISKSLVTSRLHASMRRMATVDGLTNVYNHRFFEDQLGREWKRARRYSNALTLLMLDIDHFKIYNDTHGHLQGDRVLAGVAKLIRAAVREVDLVCRYGGEEFAVILPETTVDQGLVVAEKVRTSIAGTPFRLTVRQAPEYITVSIGVADNVNEVETPADLINRADMALYDAKRAGRNRCLAYAV